jgi:hypothetical protein
MLINIQEPFKIKYDLNHKLFSIAIKNDFILK